MKIKIKAKVIIISLILMISACEDDIKSPTVTTTPITDTTWQYVVTGGEVISDGGSPVTARGVCVTTNGNTPPIINSDWNTWHTNDSSGIGSFTSTINFVYAGAAHTISQEHYLRAYATNSVGTAYGEIISVSPKSVPPTFKSIKLISLTSTSAIIDCEMGSPGERPFAIDEFYFCYSSSPDPTIDGAYSVPQQVPEWGGYYVLMDLLPNSTYYVRGYIKNESGFAYSPEISFTTWEGSLTDIDDNLYPIKTIGNQLWMARNLAVSKFNDGTVIPNIQNDYDWSVANTSASCSNQFGKLYNYYTVVDDRKLCPSGWHIPTDSEWKTLEIYLGMTSSEADNFDYRGTDEGGKLKMSSNNDFNQMVWNYPNLGATNSSGFSAQGAGWRSDAGPFNSYYNATSFWTSSEFDETSVLIRRLFYNSAQSVRLTEEKKAGLSVRCIKN